MTRSTRVVVLGLAFGLFAAACGGSATPSTADQPASPATAPPPASSAPTATAAPTPAPTRTLDPDQVAAQQALDAFAALTERDDLSFHLAQIAWMKLDGVEILSATYALDVAGDDFFGTIVAGGVTIELAYVGGTTYTRTTGGSWMSGAVLDDSSATDITSPWRYLGPFEDLGFVSRDAQNMEAFRFTNSGSLPYQTASMREQGITGMIDYLVFVVLPDGVPTSLVIHASASPKTGEMAGKPLEMFSTVDFSRVGEPLTITAPIP